ncbi:hypothetical protein [Paenibacillus prosopidis]|uniref:Uncharacterized protein n=1 Tax=Paenibacillus prosopidis TaxID=630520 RepID=A0A368VL48_9BACL|nr:hypothetical protein [Paenibacillus prosopidis]RCW42421.1 hypothetical protein DFP97_117145 [Paenibacillus prosopidis]
MNENIILKVNPLDTYKLKLLVEESAVEGFRHIKRLVNDFETGANKFDTIKMGKHSLSLIRAAMLSESVV